MSEATPTAGLPQKQGAIITELYRSGIAALMEYLRFDAVQCAGHGTADEPYGRRPRGDQNEKIATNQNRIEPMSVPR